MLPTKRYVVPTIAEQAKPAMKLGVAYHMPFWQAEDGSLWETEGSFARYIDSLAPYFEEIKLLVPVFDRPQASGSRIRSSNVTLSPLPYFPGPRQFYPMLPGMLGRIRAWVEACDVLNLRVPTPAAIFAFHMARRRAKPVFLLVVGDYEALLPYMPYRGTKKWLFAAYVAFEERALRHMVARALTFANGAALRKKHERDRRHVRETKTTTIRQEDVASRADTCQSRPIKLLSVSRIDPRKGLRIVPALVAELVARGHDVTFEIVGAAIGEIGETEGAAILADAARLGVSDRVSLPGPMALDALMAYYQQFDLFVFPARPGEGIPRVLMEAMAAGLPVITSNVAGIGSLIADGHNGLLLSDSSPKALASAVARLIESPALRQHLIRNGYDTARAHTLDRQAAELMRVASRELGLKLARVPNVA